MNRIFDHQVMAEMHNITPTGSAKAQIGPQCRKNVFFPYFPCLAFGYYKNGSILR